MAPEPQVADSWSSFFRWLRYDTLCKHSFTKVCALYLSLCDDVLGLLPLNTPEILDWESFQKYIFFLFAFACLFMHFSTFLLTMCSKAELRQLYCCHFAPPHVVSMTWIIKFVGILIIKWITNILKVQETFRVAFLINVWHIDFPIIHFN